MRERGKALYAVTPDQYRKLALALPETSEVPHRDRTAFRTPRRIFTTLAADGKSANIILAADQQAALIEARPQAFAALSGGWGRNGWTKLTLAEVSVAEAKAVLDDAHALVQSARTRTNAKKPKKKR